MGGVIAFGWTQIQQRVYTASATGTIAAAGGTEDPSSALLYENLAKSKVKSYIQWAKSRAVAEHAIDKLGLEISPEAAASRVTVTNPLDTPVLVVQANGPTPEAARDLATAWLEGLATEAKTLETGGDEGANSVIALRVTESADLPSSPTFPNTKLALLIGLLGGAIVGVLYAVLRGLLDQRLRTAEQIEREFDVPVIGTLPVERSLSDGATRLSASMGPESYDAVSNHSALAEAMREFRTNLQFVNVDNPPRILAVSSPQPGDGKSTVAANLSLAIASSGQRVVLVDADLRRPTVAKTFGLVEGVGLTDVLSGEAEISDVVQPWGTTGNLLVLGAGKHPPNPSELLASEALRKLLQDISSEALVIVDAPPIIPVTDAAILASQTDAMVIVASAGRTNAQALKKALQNLSRVNVKPVGVVLNRVPLKGPNSGYYGYRYDTYKSHANQPTSQPVQRDSGRARTRRAERNRS